MTITYVITGASRGLGYEFVKQVSATDSIIFALARNPSESKNLQELVKQNKNIHTVKLDVSNEDSIKAAADEVAKLAPGGVDILINNAGIGGSLVSTLDITRKEYLRIFETNVFGVSDTTQAFVPLLRKRGQDKTKKILNISSGLGSITLTDKIKLPFLISPAYSASKTALNMITKLNGADLAEENFVVASIHPGWVRTELGSDQADLSPEESIEKMLGVLGNLSTKDNGGFFNYDGTTLPW